MDRADGSTERLCTARLEAGLGILGRPAAPDPWIPPGRRDPRGLLRGPPKILR